MTAALVLAAAMSVFTDDFATNQTLAEHWQADGEIRSEGGHLVIAPGAKATWRGSVPEKYVLTWVEGEERRARREERTSSEKPRVVFIAGASARIIDDVVVSLPEDEDASPNLIVNSGFEHDEDSVPQYYCNRGSFNWRKHVGEEYEMWTRCFAVDAGERHSGWQSLRIVVNSLWGHLSFYPWRTATQKGAHGVFSGWMKAEKPGMKIEVAIGSDRRTFDLTTEWTRYVFASTNMPAPGIFSPVTFSVRDPWKYDGSIWLDDLQLEYGDEATEWRPSDLDESRFGVQEKEERPPAVVVRKLPSGVKPTTDLSSWEKFAADAGRFYIRRQEPINRTQAFLACDDDSLYIGYRNFGEDAAQLSHKPYFKDDTGICMNDSVEVLLRPTAEKKNYHLFCAPNGSRADAYGEDKTWDGTWTVAARDAGGAVEYLVTVPFADIAANGISRKWLFNLGRNDRHSVNPQCPGTSYTKGGDFRDDAYWASLELPADVAAKWARVADAKKSAAKPVVLGRLDFYMNEPEARWRIWDEKGRMEETSLDISGMAYGTNAVTVRAHGRDWPVEVVKLPYWKGATQINRFTRSVMHGGEQVLMVSNCLLVRENPKNDNGRYEQLEIMRKRGFRYGHLCTFSDRKLTEQTADMLDYGRSIGMDFILWTGDKDGRDETRADTRARLKDYDNIISRVATDEPELARPSDEVRDFMIEEKRHYPYTPVQMNNTTFGFPSRFADLTTDIFMLDAYLTAAEFNTVDQVLRNVDEMLKAREGVPCWFFLAGMNSIHYKQPSYAEQTAQCWGAICAGCSGVTWFLNMVGSEANWRAMIDFNREAQELKDKILSEEVCTPAQASAGPDVLRVRTSKCGDDWYLFTCNIDASPLGKVAFTLPDGAPKSGTVEVLYENRTIPLEDGKFTDSYPAHFRHIYRIKSAAK
ncbi:MAG: hypothetical protein IIZ70_03685 [Kiritimatiellae bacterium]|nr:hypothetical protein [Kiritimatiellia bacterium]